MGKQLLFAILILSFTSWLWASRQVWKQKYDVAYWQDAYEDSQLTRGDAARSWLSDYDVYAIVGYKYWHGDRPLALHAEVPPFGKYLIGLSIEVFDNQNVMSLALGVGNLALLYILGRKVWQHSLPALATVLLTSVDGQFREMLTSSNLDIPQLFLLLVSLLAFTRGLANPRWFWLSSFALGLFMATKFFFSGFVVLAVYFSYLLLAGEFAAFMTYVASLVFLPIGYVLPYVPSLILRPDAVAFIRFQRWLVDWWAGNARGNFGLVWPAILAGRWYTWWDRSMIVLNHWHLLWPVSTLVALVTLRKRVGPILLVWLWVVFYLAFMSVTAFFPRYLVLLLPFTYLLLVNLLWRLAKR